MLTLWARGEVTFVQFPLLCFLLPPLALSGQNLRMSQLLCNWEGVLPGGQRFADSSWQESFPCPICSHKVASSEWEMTDGLFLLFYVLLEIGETFIIGNSKSIFKEEREKSSGTPPAPPPPFPRPQYPTLKQVLLLFVCCLSFQKFSVRKQRHKHVSLCTREVLPESA